MCIEMSDKYYGRYGSCICDEIISRGTELSMVLPVSQNNKIRNIMLVLSG